MCGARLFCFPCLGLPGLLDWSLTFTLFLHSLLSSWTAFRYYNDGQIDSLPVHVDHVIAHCHSHQYRQHSDLQKEIVSFKYLSKILYNPVFMSAWGCLIFQASCGLSLEGRVPSMCHFCGKLLFIKSSRNLVTPSDLEGWFLAVQGLWLVLVCCLLNGEGRNAFKLTLKKKLGKFSTSVDIASSTGAAVGHYIQSCGQFLRLCSAES